MTFISKKKKKYSYDISFCIDSNQINHLVLEFVTKKVRSFKAFVLSGEVLTYFEKNSPYLYMLTIADLLR